MHRSTCCAHLRHGTEMLRCICLAVWQDQAGHLGALLQTARLPVEGCPCATLCWRQSSPSAPPSNRASQACRCGNLEHSCSRCVSSLCSLHGCDRGSTLKAACQRSVLVQLSPPAPSVWYSMGPAFPDCRAPLSADSSTPCNPVQIGTRNSCNPIDDKILLMLILAGVQWPLQPERL